MVDAATKTAVGKAPDVIHRPVTEYISDDLISNFDNLWVGQCCIREAISQKTRADTSLARLK